MSPLSPTSSEPREAARFVREFERRLQRCDRAIRLQEWNLYTGRPSADAGRADSARARLLASPGLLEWTQRARARGPSPLLERRLELLERMVLDAFVEQRPEVVRLRSELQARIARFRPRWEGRRVARGSLQQLLRQEPDPARRRRAFYALDEGYRALEPRFRRLVQLRNDAARELGHRSFVEMRLRFQGTTSRQVLAWTETIGRAARPYLRALREGRPGAEKDGGWHPWDFPRAREQRARLPDGLFPRAQMLPKILRAVRHWGFRTGPRPFRVAFRDLPFGGLALALDPPRDVRLLVRPRDGWEAIRVLFHEVGHAVQARSNRAPGHLLRWTEGVPGFGGYHEGVAGLFETIAREPAWLRSEGVAGREAEVFADAQSDVDLLAAAWQGPWIADEIALYERPSSDGGRPGRRIERETFGYDPYAPPSVVNPIAVGSPAYSANYLLAVLFQYQLAFGLRRQIGGPLWPNRQLGPWLVRHWFAAGLRVEWIPQLGRASGEPFGPRRFLERFRVT